MKNKKLLYIIIALIVAYALFSGALDLGAAPNDTSAQQSVSTVTELTQLPPDTQTDPAAAAIDENGLYTSKDDVALYIHTYGHLPQNFITKNEARSAGWDGGGLDKYFDGCSIGGDRFGNNEGLLPEAKGRSWTECDINTMHKNSRGAERIVFSNDGLIYYTGDHYESFEQLY